MRLAPFIAVAIMAVGARPLQAQAPADPAVPARLSLEDALARAIATSHRLAELRARESAAAAVLDQRKTADLPTLALQAGYQRTNHVDEFGFVQPDGSLSILYPDVPDNWRARLDMQWPIYTGGRDGALERAADAERQASQKDIDSTRADLRLETTRAFWALVTATDAERVVRESVTRIDDPEVADLLIPNDHPIGTKRICTDTNYFQTFNESHVELVSVRRTPIESIDTTGINTSDAHYDIDAIVLATGFDAMTGALAKIDIVGRDGQTVARRLGRRTAHLSRTGRRRISRICSWCRAPVRPPCWPIWCCMPRPT